LCGNSLSLILDLSDPEMEPNRTVKKSRSIATSACRMPKRKRLRNQRSTIWVRLATAKKRRHERFAVRAGRPVTQTTSSSGAIRRICSITGIITRYYRFDPKQIQKFKFSRHAVQSVISNLEAATSALVAQFPIRIRSPAKTKMTNDVKSSSSGPEPPHKLAATSGSAANGWLKVGAVAIASAALGGLAAAWFYRKTLSRLRDAENEIPDSVPETIEDVAREDF
jgi:hypothetical protein